LEKWYSANSTNAIASSGTDIYLAGSKAGTATYWKNGVATTLPGTAATVWDIAANNNNVYMVGTEAPGSSSYGKGVYWKNGVAGPIPPPSTYAQAYAVTLQDNDFYFAGISIQSVGGLDATIPTYWKNGTPLALGNQTGTDIYDIALNGSDIYVCGQNLQGSI
jgi:hypothetical protein